MHRSLPVRCVVDGAVPALSRRRLFCQFELAANRSANSRLRRSLQRRTSNCNSCVVTLLLITPPPPLLVLSVRPSLVEGRDFSFFCSLSVFSDRFASRSLRAILVLDGDECCRLRFRRTVSAVSFQLKTPAKAIQRIQRIRIAARGSEWDTVIVRALTNEKCVYFNRWKMNEMQSRGSKRIARASSFVLPSSPSLSLSLS